MFLRGVILLKINLQFHFQELNFPGLFRNEAEFDIFKLNQKLKLFCLVDVKWQKLGIEIVAYELIVRISGA